MKFIKIVLTSLLCISASTAFCQRDTVVIDTYKFEDAIVQIGQGQSAQRMLDSVKAWYREDLAEANKSISLLKKQVEADSVYQSKLLNQVAGLQMNRDLFYSKYQTEAARKHRPFGLALMPVGYNPFTRGITAGVGFIWSPNWARFSLSKVFKYDNNVVNLEADGSQGYRSLMHK